MSEHDEGCACCARGPEAVQAEADRMIAEHGFMFQAVYGSDDTPGFVYTIGLAQRGLPEFIFVGSCQPNAANYIRGAIGVAMAGGAITTGLAAPESDLNPYGVPAWILRADDKLGTHAFGVLRQIERVAAEGPPVLYQVVMPDMSGRFPWENGYDWLDQQVTTPPVSGNA